MVTEGRVQCQLVLAHPVPTRKQANPYRLLPLPLMGMGVPTRARLPLARVGYLSRNLTHLAPHHALSFRPLPVVIPRGRIRRLIAPILQVKPPPTQTRLLPLHMGSPTPVLQLKVHH